MIVNLDCFVPRNDAKHQQENLKSLKYKVFDKVNIKSLNH